MTDRISEKTVEALPSPSKGNKVYYFAGDKVQGKVAPRGFGVRVTSAGAKSFVINYRNSEGRERRYTLGSCSDWSVIRAITEAREVRRRIDRGEDPMAERTDLRSAPTVGDLCDRYEKDHLPRKRPSSQVDDKSIIGSIVRPRLGARKVRSIQYADVDKLHQSLRNTPYRANRVVALLSKMFGLSIRWGMRADNPCRGIERFAEVKRKRYLSPDEIKRLSAALVDYSNQSAANVVRLCLLTGCRRGEALGATWDQFNLKAGLWTKPGSTTKQKTEHIVPLSKAALALITRMKAEAAGDNDEPKSAFLFPGRKPESPLSEIKDEWNEIRTAAKIPDVRLHDLRHTYASILASAGQSLPIIGALLGHTQAQTTARYAHLFDDPLKKAADYVGDIVSGAKKAKVTPIRKRG